MVIVALGIVAFIGFAALTVDLGAAYSERRVAQNAADASTMAAMRMVRLADSSVTGTMVHNEILRVAALNGNAQVVSDTFLAVDSSSLGPVASYSGAWDQVAGAHVDTQIQYDTLFAPILGINTLMAAGKATAMSQLLGGISGVGVWPFAVRRPNPDFEVGTEYTIWDPAQEASGNAGWADLNGGNNSASDMASWMENGFVSSDTNPFMYWNNGTGGNPNSGTEDDELLIGKWVAGDTGSRNSAQVVAPLRDLIGKEIIVLVYDDLRQTGGNNRYHIVEFAEFTVTAVDFPGAGSYVKGRFRRTVLPGDATPTPTTGDTSTIRLTN